MLALRPVIPREMKNALNSKLPTGHFVHSPTRFVYPILLWKHVKCK
jgi:hypothetical protein